MFLYSFKNSAQNNKKRKVKSLPGSRHFLTYLNVICSRKGTPRCIRLPAVFTLEAAIILPIMASFFVSILFFFRVMQVETEVQKALNDTGRQLAVWLAKDEGDSATGIVAAQALFLKEMAGREEAQRYISGGCAGISLLESEFGRDEIHLKASYHIRLPVRIFWVWDFAMAQRADCRKWTGWSGNGENGEPDQWVYVTETGEVYHVLSTCTHLDLSIRGVEREQLYLLRNEAGEKYQKCALCGADSLGGRVFITSQGDCYHCDLNCSGIKRTVSMIRPSEVGTRRRCSRCGT